MSISVSFLILTSSAVGSIIKCTSDTGKVIFTDSVCPNGYHGNEKKALNKTNKTTIEYGRYEFRELLQFDFQHLHDMWIAINEKDTGYNFRYACSIERALNYAAKQRAIDDLEEATTTREILSASEEYGEAANDLTYNLYCN